MPRPTKLSPVQIEEIKQQLNNPYHGQCVFLAGVYGVKPSYIRKLKQRYKNKTQ